MALLETRNATKRFGGLTAVNDLTFDLDEGAIVSVIGPNGAGKTTFFNCIAGFYQIDEGSITIDGTDIHELRPDKIARLGLARTYQNIRLFSGMTAAENVLVGQHQHLSSSWVHAVLRTRGQRNEEAEAVEEAERLLAYVGLEGTGDINDNDINIGYTNPSLITPEMKNNLADMIARSREAGSQVVLIGVQLPPNYGPRYTERFESVYRELASEYDLPLLPSLVDGIGTERRLMQRDGIHPNASAQPLITERVWQVLEPLLEPAGRS